MEEPFYLPDDQTPVNGMLTDFRHMVERGKFITPHGMYEYFTALGKLQTESFVAIPDFLTDKGVDELINHTSIHEGRFAKDLYDFFDATCMYGFKRSYKNSADTSVRKVIGTKDDSPIDIANAPRAYTYHRDHSSHTPLLNPICPPGAYYEVLPESDPYDPEPTPFVVPIEEHQLFILSGKYARDEYNRLATARHRVNPGPGGIDTRLRIMQFKPIYI